MTQRVLSVNVTRRALALCAATMLCGGALLRADITFEANVPGFGSVPITIPQTTPEGAVQGPGAPDAAPFRPPSIFSAPLPTGSGARALGLAGAFTAIADDATAASWNPAGLIQLERPETSIMYRYDHERDRHTSTDAGFAVGEDEFDNHSLNYVSAVIPFYIVPLKRNAVFSLNYQETYDFETRFTADLTQRQGERSRETGSSTFSERVVGNQTQVAGSSTLFLSWVADLETDITSILDQIIESDLLTGLDFEQEGIIDSVTPALAVEVTPKLSVGGAVNAYMDSPVNGGGITSRTRATYSGSSDSRSSIRTDRVTDGQIRFLASSRIVTVLPFFGTITIFPFASDRVEPIDTQTETDTTHNQSRIVFDGEYEEYTKIDDLHGVNGTFGFLWSVSRFLGLAGSVDLPWTAKARQQTTVRTKVTTYNADRSRELDRSDSVQTQVRDVEFEFPLYWAVGMVLRWTPYFYTSLDVSQATWSDFSFKAEGQRRVNPLDGTPFGENPLDDTWSVRAGAELLKVGRKAEIPFRVGGAWEQRPAIGRPDDYYSVSAGTGIAIGKDDDKLIFDLAYIFTFADDVRGIVADQPGLTTDVRQHQVFLSVIQHF